MTCQSAEAAAAEEEEEDAIVEIYSVSVALAARETQLRLYCPYSSTCNLL